MRVNMYFPPDNATPEQLAKLEEEIRRRQMGEETPLDGIWGSAIDGKEGDVFDLIIFRNEEGGTCPKFKVMKREPS